MKIYKTVFFIKSVKLKIKKVYQNIILVKSIELNLRKFTEPDKGYSSWKGQFWGLYRFVR